MMMPRVSGMDVHRWLVEHHPVLARRLVFMTGGAFTPNTREYLEKVDNLQIAKPFDPATIRKTVAELVLEVNAKDPAMRAPGDDNDRSIANNPAACASPK